MAYDKKKPRKINISVVQLCACALLASGDAFLVYTHRPCSKNMKYLLALCLVVLATARPRDDEWEQFKKVSFTTLNRSQYAGIFTIFLFCRHMAKAMTVMKKNCDETPSGKLTSNTLRHTMPMLTNLALSWG